KVSVTVGAPREGTGRSYVSIYRNWTYNCSYHFPYTSIPFGRGDVPDGHLLESDREWLRHLASDPGGIVGQFPGPYFEDAPYWALFPPPLGPPDRDPLFPQ